MTRRRGPAMPMKQRVTPSPSPALSGHWQSAARAAGGPRPRAAAGTGITMVCSPRVCRVTVLVRGRHRDSDSDRAPAGTVTYRAQGSAAWQGRAKM